VIAAASYLQIDDLISLCSEQLILTISKFWNLVLRIANCYALSNVRRAVCKHIAKNLHQIQHDAGETWNSFMNLPVLDLCLVLDDSDCSITELEIFNVAIAWLKHDVVRITSHSSEVLAVVRFPLMLSEDLQACSMELTLSDIPAECYQKLLEEAATYHSEAGGCTVLSSHRTRMRNSVNVVIALGGFTASEHSTNRFQVLPVADLLENSTKEIRLGFLLCCCVTVTILTVCL